MNPIIIGAILAITILRRISIRWGSLLGAAVATYIGVWGWFTYQSGGGVQLAGRELPLGIFIALVGAWAAWEVRAVLLTYKK